MFLSKAVVVCPPANGGAAAASPAESLRLVSWITAGRPHFFVALSVLALGCGAWFLSFLLRFEFTIPDSWRTPSVQSLPLVLLVQGLCFYGHGVFRILWPYVSVRDAFVILRSAIYATSILLAINVFAPGTGLAPMSVILIHGIVTHMAVCGLFLVLRFLREAQFRT